jgi:hypothetical protein
VIDVFLDGTVSVVLDDVRLAKVPVSPVQVENIRPEGGGLASTVTTRPAG